MLCITLSICFLIPSFVLAGSDHYENINYVLGVNTVCDGYSCSTYGKGRIRLSFVDGVSHMPEEDYTCSVYVKLTLTGFGLANRELETGFEQTMDLTLKLNRPNTTQSVISALYICYVNSHNNEIRNQTMPV